MKKEKTIHFIITGGTIDSFYNSSVDTVTPNKNSVIPDFIKSLKLENKIKFTTVCMKDSRQLTKEDMSNMLHEIENSASKHMIITHGTYTMPDSARFIEAQLKSKDKVVVLTGSMIPISGFSPSDGPFNLGYSLAQLDYLSPGVYVCMNGTVFEPREVMKFMQEGRFISVFGEK